MTYYESAEGVEINRDQAYVVLAKHGLCRTDPDFTEWADDRSWPAQATDLLDWLGY